MADPKLELRLTADGSGLTGTLRTASGELREFAASAGKAGTQGVVSGAAIEKSWSSAGAAIGGTVAATQLYADESSLVIVRNGGIGKSARALAEAQGLVTFASIEQRQAMMAEGVASRAKVAIEMQAIAAAEETAAATGVVTAVTRVGTAALRENTVAQEANAVSSRTSYELGVLLSEGASGNFSRAKRSVAALGNSSGLLAAAFTGVGAAVLSVVAVIGGALTMFVKGTAEIDDFNKALIATDGFAGLTGAELVALTTKLGTANGHFGDTQKALTELVNAGKLSGDALVQAAQGAIDFATLTGKAIDDGVAAFDRLAQDPVKNVVAMNDQLHFLTVAVYEHIVALEKQGDTEGAVALATKTMADALANRVAEYKKNQDVISGGWDEIKRSIGGAIDAAKTFVANGAHPIDALANYASAFTSSLFNGTSIDAELAAQQKLKLGADGLTAASKAQAAADTAATIAAEQRSDHLIASYDKQAEKLAKIKQEAQDLFTIFQHGGTLPAGVNFNGPFSDQPQGPGWDAIVAGINGKPIVDADKAANALAKALNGLAKAEKALDDQLDHLRGTVSAAAEAQAEFDKGTRQLETNAIALAIAGGDVDEIIKKWREGEALLNAALVKSNAEIAKRNQLTNGNKDLIAQLTQQRERIAGLTAAQINYNARVREAHTLAEQAANDGVAADAIAAGLADRLTQLAEIRDNEPVVSLVEQFGSKSEYDQLVENLGRVEEAMIKAMNPEQLAAYFAALKLAGVNIKKTMEEINMSLLGQGISSLQKFAKEGTVAYTALGIAQDILAYKAAITAIATQGGGDPYTAFARIAAMIALMASIGIRVGGGGGGAPSAQSAEVRQQTQGTGSVLGDSTAKSESILKATEITANATQQLVGLNRGMLIALQALQSALGAAGGSLARGAGDAAFPGLQSADHGILDTLDPGPIGNSARTLVFGGSQSVIDQGIVIAGGTLGDMLNKIVVGAYQTIHTSGGWFSDGSNSTQLGGVSDEFSKQFGLVIKSIADTVRAGALALGLLPADVEAAIASFKVEEIKISLQGLSAADQQAALEAVFSKLFDGLAGAVVPFIGQFQQVGEGLGETLIRVATEVQVTQEAFKQLGITVDEVDPEKFAQISDALVTAAGGLDAFISGLQSFVEHFAPEGHQFEVDSAALTSAFAQVGLAVPATRDGMWELMQSLDATTEAGRAQIATLLRLAGVSDEYYTELDKQAKPLRDLFISIGLLTGGLSNLGNAIVAIKTQEKQGIDAANALAIAQGREGASTFQIAQIHDWASKQIAAAIRRIAQETQDLKAQLYGGIGGTLGEINAQIAAIEGQSAGATNAIGGVAQASNDLFQQWRDGIKSLSDYLNQSLFGDLSPLNPEQQLAAAQSQLDTAIAAASGGDATALASLPQLMDQFAQLLHDSTASGGDYNGTITNYQAQLRALLGMQGPADLGGQGTGGGGGAVTVVASPELQALYEARDAALAQQETEHRAILAQQLAQNLHDLAVLTRTPILDMIDLQGVALDKLATDMGVDLTNLTGASVLALGNMATTLGLSLGDLTTALGLNLTDLGAGVTELTTRLGIDLSNLTVSSTETLAELATSLGADVTDLAQSVGVDLGSLADAQSLLNQALGDTIDQLPDGTRDQLQPLFDAIASATTEADANAAIQALEDQVNLLGGDTATALAPYLADVFPPDALDQLDYLGDLQDIGHDQLDVLKDIARGLDVPGYAVGTGYVPQTGLALIHQGEAVIPAPMATWMRSNGLPMARGASNDGNASVVAELRQLRVEVAQLRTENNAVVRDSTDALRTEGDKARRQREEIARQQTDLVRSRNYG